VRVSQDCHFAGLQCNRSPSVGIKADEFAIFGHFHLVGEFPFEILKLILQTSETSAMRRAWWVRLDDMASPRGAGAPAAAAIQPHGNAIIFGGMDLRDHHAPNAESPAIFARCSLTVSRRDRTMIFGKLTLNLLHGCKSQEDIQAAIFSFFFIPRKSQHSPLANATFLGMGGYRNRLSRRFPATPFHFSKT